MKIGVLFQPVIFLLFAVSLAGCRPAPPATSLPDAAKSGQLNLVKQHIAAKSELDVRDSVGLTAAHHAAIRGDLPMIQALAAAGADLSAPNAIGKTPLDLARHNGRPLVAQFLEQRAHAKTGATGRGLMDGGLGVSGVLDGP